MNVHHDRLRFPTLEISNPAYEHDGLRLVTIKSPALGQRADVSFWVPDATRIPTLLILLHGVYGSHWVWSLKAGAHRTAQAMLRSGEIGPMVIAMPSDALKDDGSAYLRWPEAQDAERWIVNEVPAIAQLAAPALLRHCKVAIAGLSMGGYGALRLGAKYAQNFSAISAHSAITKIEEMASFTNEPIQRYLSCGPNAELSALYWLRRQRHMLPPVRFDCGLEDGLLGGNRELHRALTQDGIAHEYQELPGGHDWSYWQTHLPETLRHADRHCRESW